MVREGRRMRKSEGGGETDSWRGEESVAILKQPSLPVSTRIQVPNS